MSPKDLFSVKVCSNLESKLDSTEHAIELTNKYDSFVNYCYNNFDKSDKEVDKCAIGILLKFDFQKNPNKYESYNMDSMFDVHLIAGRFARDENYSALRQLEDEVTEYFK